MPSLDEILQQLTNFPKPANGDYRSLRPSTDDMMELANNVGGIGSIRLVGPFSKAHKVAQKNAALPVEQGGLGLAKNNTAQERAAAMGFNTQRPLYHGTTADFNEFSLGHTNKAEKVRLGPQGIIATSFSPKLASNWPSSTEGVQVMPLYGKTKEAWNPSDKFDAALARDYIYDKSKQLLDDNELKEWTTAELDLGPSFFKHFDYSGGLHNIEDTENFVTHKPENLRSIFAAFDPKKAESKNLLASLVGISLLGTLLNTKGENK